RGRTPRVAGHRLRALPPLHRKAPRGPPADPIAPKTDPITPARLHEPGELCQWAWGTAPARVRQREGVTPSHARKARVKEFGCAKPTRNATSAALSSVLSSRRRAVSCRTSESTAWK